MELNWNARSWLNIDYKFVYYFLFSKHIILGVSDQYLYYVHHVKFNLRELLDIRQHCHTFSRSKAKYPPGWVGGFKYN